MPAVLVPAKPAVAANRPFDGSPLHVVTHETECEAILDYCRKKFAAWQSALPDDPRRPYTMSRVPDELRESFYDLCQIWSSGPLSVRLMPLLHFVERVALGFVKWCGERRWRDEQPPLELTQAAHMLFAARDAMDAAPRELPPLEPIAVLDKQGVSFKQIALMWGLSEAVVAKELQQPGQHVPADYVPPTHRPEALEAKRSDRSSWSTGSQITACVAILNRLKDEEGI